MTFVVFIQIARPKLQEATFPSVPPPACCVSVPSCRASLAWPGTIRSCSPSELSLPSQHGLLACREARSTGSKLSAATGHEQAPNDASTAARGCSASPGAVLCAWPPLTTSGPVRAFTWATALLERTDSFSGAAELPLSSLRLSSKGLAEQPRDAVTASWVGNRSSSSLLFWMSSSSLDITAAVSAI